MCQSFSLTDQLEMGLRHLEIDITAAYYKLPPKLTDIHVCHSPVPLTRRSWRRWSWPRTSSTST